MAARTLNLARITICAAALVLLRTHSFAGNKELVEERVRELDSLNKEVLSEVPDLPENGRIEIKARVKERKDGFVFDIQEKKITTGGTPEGEAVTSDPPAGPVEDAATDEPSGTTGDPPVENVAADKPSGGEAAHEPSADKAAAGSPSVEKATPVKEGTLNFGTE